MKKIKGFLFLSLIMAALLSLGGCGVKVSNKSPESVAKSIVNAYIKEDEAAIKKCYGVNPKEKCAEEITREIKYNINQFKAHGASEVNFIKSDSLGNFNGFNLVYVIYNLKKKDVDSKKSEALEVPGINLYFVKEKEKKYYVVPAKDISEDLSKISGEEFAKFMKTEEYKNYEKDYKKFIRKNPDYEEQLKKAIEDLSKQ